jgi:ribonuclease P protein component
MIKRAHRFHGNNSLRAVYRRAQTVRGPLLSLKVVANQRPAGYRAAVVVSRKVSKLAVVRNRIRRRIYEIIRAQASQLSASDLVITVFGPELATLPHDQLEAAIIDLLIKAGALGVVKDQ